MKLEYLKLTNFRGFRSFEISFDPTFTVLLGGNMAGKTAVLDGAVFALRQVLRGTQVAKEIDDDDVFQSVVSIRGVPDLQRQFPSTIEARATEYREIKTATWWLTRPEAQALSRVGGNLYHLMAPPPDRTLPVIAHYGTERSWSRDVGPKDIRGVGTRSDGYKGCFHVRSTHGELAGWIRKQTLVQLQKGGGYVQPQLAAVVAAVKSCIGGLTRLWFDVEHDELRLERTGGDIQSFPMLSEGYRNMVAMVADIAWRASVLNPHHGPEAHHLTDGTVLIDELDLHLHPAWQRRIVGDLRRTFPRIQFIVTTHSPQIVASVSRAQVRLLDGNRLVADDVHVEGRDSNALLEDVFGVPARPQEVQDEIDAMFRSIEDQNFAAAREQVARLLERLGPDDPAIIRARWMLDADDPQPQARPPSAA